MTSLGRGDESSANEPSNSISSHESLMNRLAERHSQAKVAQMRRIQQRSTNPGGLGGGEKSAEFLQQILQAKSNILSGLDDALVRLKRGLCSVQEITQLIDKTVTSLEEMQASLNDAALYLTHFDLEQARLELKNLSTQFQSRREQLLPTKKFSFSVQSKQPDQARGPTGRDANDGPAEAKSDLNHLWQFDEKFSFVNIQGPQTLFIPKSKFDEDELYGQSIYLADLTDCTVNVTRVCGNMTIRRLKQCKVYAHPIAGSVWMEDCKECDFVLACRQLRIHQTMNCRMWLHVASRPIIEHSTGISVAPYALTYTELSNEIRKSGLDKEINLWSEVEDFSHPNKRLTTGSPNWSILPKSEWSAISSFCVA